MLDGFGGVFIAIVLGALAAIGVAITLSPLAPIGPVRSIDPSPGVNVDWTVLGLGFLLLVGYARSGRTCMLPTVPHRTAIS